jgi:hypothetical protein
VSGLISGCCKFTSFLPGGAGGRRIVRLRRGVGVRSEPLVLLGAVNFFTTFRHNLLQASVLGEGSFDLTFLCYMP